MSLISIASWIAIVMLSVSYWFQIWKIHVHREVRDLSLPYHILLSIGFLILAFTAYAEGSLIFLVKQVFTTIPVIIIIGQILYHKKDRWHDEGAALCHSCLQELEDEWEFCPFCGMADDSDITFH